MIIALFFSFKSWGAKWAVSTELRYYGLNAISLFCLCFTEPYIFRIYILLGFVVILTLLFVLTADFVVHNFNLWFVLILVGACHLTADTVGLHFSLPLLQTFFSSFLFSCWNSPIILYKSLDKLSLVFLSLCFHFVVFASTSFLTHCLHVFQPYIFCASFWRLTRSDSRCCISSICTFLCDSFSSLICFDSCCHLSYNRMFLCSLFSFSFTIIIFQAPLL